ncbi:hypothetical protein Tsubulata_025772 [Turnera subulata]|uniref:CCHC-type domain-containing protein n=1 Tax=Turnera subulata TaxID=218843 RepID=A0A9Q0JNZ8_9ROSI|nr:hypothetical protein Tsubulata_025772 [Turnera subulata]
MKINEVTLKSSRVKFARVCVEVDLSKPLVSKFRLCQRIWRVVYEGLNTVCFKCGRYGHTLDGCSFHSATEVNVDSDIPPEVVEKRGEEQMEDIEVSRPELVSNHGPWMIAQRRRRGKPRGASTGSGSNDLLLHQQASGSRFSILSEPNDSGTQTMVDGVSAMTAVDKEVSARPALITTKSANGKAPMHAKDLVIMPPRPVANKSMQVTHDYGCLFAYVGGAGFQSIHEINKTAGPGLLPTESLLRGDLIGIFGWKRMAFRVVYGPYGEERLVLYGSLVMVQSVTRPWVLLGDFNETISQDEKQGGVPISQARCDKFRDWIEECRLLDLGYSGPKFTWRG